MTTKYTSHTNMNMNMKNVKEVLASMFIGSIIGLMFYIGLCLSVPINN